MQPSQSQTAIEKSIQINAPVSRVWQALTDHRQFGEWFRVAIDAPFQPGQPANGRILHPGYEHLRWQVIVQKIEPQHTFSFTWHPYAIDPAVDYSQETPTLVVFTLTPTPGGTLLRVVESGFEHIPTHRRAEAFLKNGGGWTAQMHNIEVYVTQHP